MYAIDEIVSIVYSCIPLTRLLVLFIHVCRWREWVDGARLVLFRLLLCLVSFIGRRRTPMPMRRVGGAQFCVAPIPMRGAVGAQLCVAPIPMRGRRGVTLRGADAHEGPEGCNSAWRRCPWEGPEERNSAWRRCPWEGPQGRNSAWRRLTTTNLW